jgi:uncharacterized peroxidase-related enzyme
MGLLIARENGSSYLAVHMSRLLKGAERGQTLPRALSADLMREKERVALRYAVDLSRAIDGVGDTAFAQARAFYNDSQLIELTAVTAFFNHFARFCQGAGLALEPWTKHAPNSLPVPVRARENRARVTLASDAEIRMAAKHANPSTEPPREMGHAIANSRRAILRVPELGEAWYGFRQALRQERKLSRETLHRIAFAVSLANGCRYCVVREVAALRRMGVEPATLLAMREGDAVLAPRERAAVTFARKLTRKPGAVRQSDFAALRAGLGDDTDAMDALLQTCAFNFMNRFTDGLRLPSEEEAIRVFQQVYGEGSYHTFSPRRQY